MCLVDRCPIWMPTTVVTGPTPSASQLKRCLEAMGAARQGNGLNRFNINGGGNEHEAWRSYRCGCRLGHAKTEKPLIAPLATFMDEIALYKARTRRNKQVSSCHTGRLHLESTGIH